VVLTILGKCILISLVVWLFKFPARTAVAVGLSMAQIGEFAFVLLSVASQLGLMPYQVYMLLMGTSCNPPPLPSASPCLISKSPLAADLVPDL